VARQCRGGSLVKGWWGSSFGELHKGLGCPWAYSRGKMGGGENCHWWPQKGKNRGGWWWLTGDGIWDSEAATDKR
jgi:hypothetical protein